MSLFRMPLTTWSYLVSAALGLLAFPSLFAAVILLLCDRHFGTSFYLPSGLFFGKKLLPNEGGTPLLWQHLFWFLGHPEVYVVALPAWGIVLDLIPVFTRKPVFGYRVNVYCFYAIAVLSLAVWGHHMYVSGMSPYAGEFFAVATLAITIPSTVLGVNMLASLWGGAIRFRLPMLFAIGSIVMFGTGGFGGIFLGNAASDIQLHETYFVVGHFHLMIGGVTLMATFAALHYWFPRMFGRMMDETLGKIHFWLTFPTFYFIFLLMHFDGFAGMPRRYYSWDKYDYLAPVRGHAALDQPACLPAGRGATALPLQFLPQHPPRTQGRTQSMERRHPGVAVRRRRSPPLAIRLQPARRGLRLYAADGEAGATVVSYRGVTNLRASRR